MTPAELEAENAAFNAKAAADIAAIGELVRQRSRRLLRDCVPIRATGAVKVGDGSRWLPAVRVPERRAAAADLPRVLRLEPDGLATVAWRFLEDGPVRRAVLIADARRPVRARLKLAFALERDRDFLGWIAQAGALGLTAEPLDTIDGTLAALTVPVEPLLDWLEATAPEVR